MTVFEYLTIAVIVVLGTAATLAIYLGLLNWMGGFHVVHCDACHHLTFSSQNKPSHSCPHCAHPVLLHPLYAASHRGQPVRVLADPLKY